jgi:hypothetical protein
MKSDHDLLDALTQKIRETPPRWEPSEAWTDQMMERIISCPRENHPLPRILLWLRTSSGIAAGLLIGMLLWNHALEEYRPETTPEMTETTTGAVILSQETLSLPATSHPGAYSSEGFLNSYLNHLRRNTQKNAQNRQRYENF